MQFLISSSISPFLSLFSIFLSVLAFLFSSLLSGNDFTPPLLRPLVIPSPHPLICFVVHLFIKLISRIYSNESPTLSLFHSSSLSLSLSFRFPLISIFDRLVLSLSLSDASSSVFG